MADPTGIAARAEEEVFEMEKKRGLRDTEKTVTGVSPSSEGRGSGDATTVNPDPLAHLPEHFRKEIEEQSAVSSRKVSFKVHINHKQFIDC
jgi:hypothetical protein